MEAAEWVYLNGEVVARDRATISPLDRGFLYGDGFFETTRIVAGVPLLLGRHLERLAYSCLAARISGISYVMEADKEEAARILG